MLQGIIIRGNWCGEIAISVEMRRYVVWGPMMMSVMGTRMNLDARGN